MSTLALSGAVLAAAHEQFLAALPVMQRVIRFKFKHLPAWCRDELVHDGLAASWHAWWGLVRRGQDPIKVGITAIAANAARYTRNGRRLGTGTASRAAADVHNPRAQKTHRFRLISLDRHDELGSDVTSDAWREWLVEDRRIGPGDLAAIRLDFRNWLSGLPKRRRRMAEVLAEGGETGVVAGMLGITPGAVSQWRRRLESDWQRFQGEAASSEAKPANRPVGRPRKIDRRAQRRSGQRAMVPLVAAGA
jgi:hypothetical protein